MTPSTPQRFDRQVRFASLGTEGQERIAQARVLLVGTGALGGVLAQSLVRAGIGELVLADRDIVELSNLPRQVLFDDAHAQQGQAKVLAAAETLARIGGPTHLTCHAVHVDGRNLAELSEGCDLILDGTDNLSTRYLINDYCVQHGLPWIYGGVVGGAGLVLPILPGRGPCLRCVFRNPPPSGTLPTCDTAGVIMPAVGLVGSMQAGLALRILAGSTQPETALIELDAWNGECRRLVAKADPECPCCAQQKFEFWEQAQGDETLTLCGRNTVQVQRQGAAPDMDLLAERLRPVAKRVVRAGPLLRAEIEDLVLTVFPDGRTLIEGTDDPHRAQGMFDRWIGG